MAKRTKRSSGGRGEALADGLEDPAQRHQTLVAVRSAIRQGWNIPAEVLDALPEEVALIALNVTKNGRRAKHRVRDRLRAGALLVSMHRANQDRTTHRETLTARIGDGQRAMVASEAVRALEDAIADPDVREQAARAIMDRAGPRVDVQVNVGDVR